MFLNFFGCKHTCKRTFDGLKKGDCFHFIAIGGVGQSALAKILVKLGYKVSGSDMSDSKYLKELKTLGAKVFIGHNSDNVPNDCFVVLSSAIKEDNSEYIRAKELGLTILHRSDLLCAITHEFALTIGFAGTHGKTTTSGLCSYVLSKMNKKAAYAVGGIIPELNTNADADKNSTMFAAELDESDGTIVKYAPEILVINNLSKDKLIAEITIPPTIVLKNNGRITSLKNLINNDDVKVNISLQNRTMHLRIAPYQVLWLEL